MNALIVVGAVVALLFVLLALYGIAAFPDHIPAVHRWLERWPE